MLVRDCRASLNSQYVCGSRNKGEITIWDIESLVEIASVRPGFSGGKERYIVDSETSVVYSGTWEEGLTAFDYVAKKPLWHRPDLVGIQRVDMSAGLPSSLFVSLEAPDYRVGDPGVFNGIAEIDVSSGDTLEKTEGFYRLIAHTSLPVLVLEDRAEKLIRVVDRQDERVATTEMLHFALLDVAFGEGFIALAEGVKGTRIIDHDGNTVSRNVPPNWKPNCLDIGFDGDVVCVFDSWDGSFISLIDPASGAILSEYEAATGGGVCFVGDGSRYVDGRGVVSRSRDGEVVGRLEV